MISLSMQKVEYKRPLQNESLWIASLTLLKVS